MSDFIRARSGEQKEQRMGEIKRAADELFAQVPYHEITLATIADKLGWSRASLYKYVATKEEVFLAIAADKRDAYTAALLAAFPEGCSYPRDVTAEVWAGILNAHRDFLRYGDLLFTIIETNVSVEKLAAFKKGYYEGLAETTERFSRNLGIPAERAERMAGAVYHQAVGLSSSCADNPLVRDALALAGIEVEPVDFRAEMRDFVSMCLEHYRPQEAR